MKTHRLPGRALLMALLFLVVMSAAPGSANAARSTSRHTSTVIPSRATGNVGAVTAIVQTWNNCGPASIAEVLQYWGIRRTQDQVAAVVRGDNAPWGMAPFGVPGYARSVGARALLGANGNARVIKGLISNGFPVIVSQWVSVSDHVRHYRPIVAYDDRKQVFISSDPYLGAGHIIKYTNFATMWAVSDNRFLVLAPPSRQNLLNAVLASSGWIKSRAFGRDLAWQQNRLRMAVKRAGEPIARYYGLPSIAWDEIELGNTGAARQTIRQAERQGANPVVIGWIHAEIAWRSVNSVHQTHRKAKSHNRA